MKTISVRNLRNLIKEILQQTCPYCGGPASGGPGECYIGFNKVDCVNANKQPAPVDDPLAIVRAGRRQPVGAIGLHPSQFGCQRDKDNLANQHGIEHPHRGNHIVDAFERALRGYLRSRNSATLPAGADIDNGTYFGDGDNLGFTSGTKDLGAVWELTDEFPPGHPDEPTSFDDVALHFLYDEASGTWKFNGRGSP